MDKGFPDLGKVKVIKLCWQMKAEVTKAVREEGNLSWKGFDCGSEKQWWKPRRESERREC